MILIKDNVEMANLAFTKSINKEPVSNYSILFQNTITKDVTVINCVSDGNNLYLKFTVDLSGLDSGEYLVMLFENPSLSIFEVDNNDLSNVQANSIVYLAIDGALLTEDDFFLVMESGEKSQIKPIKTDLLRIGEYKRNSMTYRSEQTYIQYQK